MTNALKALATIAPLLLGPPPAAAVDETVWIYHAKEDLGGSAPTRRVTWPWVDSIPWDRLGYDLTLYQTSDRAGLGPLLLTSSPLVELFPQGTPFRWTDTISGEDLVVTYEGVFYGWQDFAVWLGDVMNAESVPGWTDTFEAYYEGTATNVVRIRRPWSSVWCAEDVLEPSSGWHLMGWNERWPARLCGVENLFQPPFVVDGGTILTR